MNHVRSLLSATVCWVLGSFATATWERVLVAAPAPPQKGNSLMIGLANARVRFGTRTIFDDLSFCVPGGERVAISGPNGHGKPRGCARRALSGGRAALRPGAVRLTQDEAALYRQIQTVKS